MEKYDGYWQENLPYLDQVTFKITADVDTAFMELQAGTIDILKYLNNTQVQTLGDQFKIEEGG